MSKHSEPSDYYDRKSSGKCNNDSDIDEFDDGKEEKQSDLPAVNMQVLAIEFLTPEIDEITAPLTIKIVFDLDCEVVSVLGVCEYVFVSMLIFVVVHSITSDFIVVYTYLQVAGVWDFKFLVDTAGRRVIKQLAEVVEDYPDGENDMVFKIDKIDVSDIEPSTLTNSGLLMASFSVHEIEIVSVNMVINVSKDPKTGQIMREILSPL